jgi:phospholipid/cholesterol/gamma-HCH transport system ATP-binding protein
MIEVHSLTKSYNSRLVLKGVSFDLDAGEIVGLIGPSGGGKSVLLKLMASVIEPDTGEVVYDEAEKNPVGSLKEMHVGFLFQEGALFDSMSVLENVAFPLRVVKDITYSKSEKCEFQKGVSKEEAFQRAHEILCQVGLKDACKKYPGQLSGGMRRRVGIARALVSRPELVLLDDPTGGLDPVAASVIMSLIKDLHSSYSPTIVLSSHDIRRLIPIISRLLSLFDGKLISDVRIENLLTEAPQEVISFLKTRYDFKESPHAP